MKDFNLLIGGPAGSGIEKSGKVLALSFTRAGYHVFANGEYMSQIRGGNNFTRIRVGETRRECHLEKVSVLIAFDQQTIKEHIRDIEEKGVIIFDGEGVSLPEGYESRLADKKIQIINEPLKKLATEEIGNPLMENVIALGIVCGLVDFSAKIMKGVLHKIFGAKSAEIIKLNEKALDLGIKLAKEKWTNDFPYKLDKAEERDRLLVVGNDALCIGAIKAGCKFVGEYPMTPSSSVLHFMAAWAEKYGIVVKHTEDEIAAVNSLIGAGFAGARAMAATSGGGFALMTEGIGLASMNEVPIVVVNVMRPGPATGQPTRTEMGDLRQIIHAGQGDPVKIVLLPGDPYECFEFGFMAFNLAEKYQVPIIIGYDKYLGESLFAVDRFNEKGLRVERGKVLSEKDLVKMKERGEEYKRYLFTEDGVSARTLPGTIGGIHCATSDEHNEYGEIFESAENRKAMVEKRMKKLKSAISDLPRALMFGKTDAEVTFVTWAGAKSACVEAAEILQNEGVRANVLQIRTAWPFLSEDVTEILNGCKRPVLVESNFTAQMGGLIAESTGIVIKEKILKYDGRPINAEFVVSEFKKINSSPGRKVR